MEFDTSHNYHNIKTTSGKDYRRRKVEPNSGALEGRFGPGQQGQTFIYSRFTID
jgi:hypothetical protein